MPGIKILRSKKIPDFRKKTSNVVKSSQFSTNLEFFRIKFYSFFLNFIMKFSNLSHQLRKFGDPSAIPSFGGRVGVKV